MRRSIAAIAVVLTSLSLTTPAYADGIRQLIQVAQIKAENANDEALLAADRQRELVREQRELRAQQRQLESLQ
jgi:hypothetical protein